MGEPLVEVSTTVVSKEPGRGHFGRFLRLLRSTASSATMLAITVACTPKNPIAAVRTARVATFVRLRTEGGRMPRPYRSGMTGPGIAVGVSVAEIAPRSSSALHPAACPLLPSMP